MRYSSHCHSLNSQTKHSTFDDIQCTFQMPKMFIKSLLFNHVLLLLMGIRIVYHWVQHFCQHKIGYPRKIVYNNVATICTTISPQFALKSLLCCQQLHITDQFTYQCNLVSQLYQVRAAIHNGTLFWIHGQ